MDLDTSKCLDRHEFSQTEELPSVGGENGDLGGQILLAQEVLAQLHHKVCLMLVLVTFAFLDLLLRKVVLHKEKVGGDTLENKAAGSTSAPGGNRSLTCAVHVRDLGATPQLSERHLRTLITEPQEEPLCFLCPPPPDFTSDVSHVFYLRPWH